MRDVSGELPEDRSYDHVGRKMVRRRRRKTLPGEPMPFNRWRKREIAPGLFKVRIGDVLAEVTPRQAVVWLLNFDTIIALYEATTDQQLNESQRTGLQTSLREILLAHKRRARI